MANNKWNIWKLFSWFSKKDENNKDEQLKRQIQQKIKQAEQQNKIDHKTANFGPAQYHHHEEDDHLQTITMSSYEMIDYDNDPTVITSDLSIDEKE